MFTLLSHTCVVDAGMGHGFLGSVLWHKLEIGTINIRVFNLNFYLG